MPYKKESPFASFRDPKRTKTNYNPTNFQMPDISSIYSQTADGEKVDEVDDTKKTDDKTVDLVNKGEKTKQEATEGPVTRKALRQNRKAGEKEFNKELRRNRRLSKASSKDVTAKERDFYERATRDIQKEKDFRKKAAKMGENPADVMLKPMKTIEGGNVSTEKSKIPTRPGGNIETNNKMRTDVVKPNETKKDTKETLKNTKFNYTGFSPNERKAHRVLMGAGASTKDAFDYVTYNFADDETKGMIDRMKASEKEMEEYKKSKGLDMKQVNSKGSGFPMVSPLNAVTAGAEMADQNQKQAINKQMQPMQNQQQATGYGDPTTTVTPNRAGKGQNSNVLTSDPNINQPANKVPASAEAQNQFFSTKASSSPAPNPVMPPNMVPATTPGMSSGVGSPAGTFTSTGQGGSGATGINRENLFLNEAAAMYSDGPSKALVGNQDRLPDHLKAKIEAAPGMYSPFEFTPGGTRTEVGKRSKGGKTTTTYRRDGSKKSEFTEKDSGTKKETRYTGSPRSLSTKAVKVDVKDNATRTYTKYKKDGSVKKTMTANNKGGVDIKKAKKLRTKNQRAKKGTKLK